MQIFKIRHLCSPALVDAAGIVSCNQIYMDCLSFMRCALNLVSMVKKTLSLTCEERMGYPWSSSGPSLGREARRDSAETRVRSGADPRFSACFFETHPEPRYAGGSAYVAGIWDELHLS